MPFDVNNTYITKHYICARYPVIEGGASRLSAFIKLLAVGSTKQKIYTRSTLLGRAIDCVHMFFSMLLDKEEIVLIHYSNFPLFFSCKIFGVKFFSKAISALIDWCGKSNMLYLEVNDLPFEQSIDLDIASNKMDVFDSFLFSKRNLHFIFASREMSKYVQNKYNVDESKISVIINGSWPLENSRLKNKPKANVRRCIKFVYAGTLNRGRQIAQIIDLFNNFGHELILMGTCGDWIPNYINGMKGITYLGPIPEDAAHIIVSQCDVGIIPYDSNKFYYNMCYPTKASFYVTAGITFLSPPLIELNNHYSDEVVFFIPTEQWSSLLADPDIDDIVHKKCVAIRDGLYILFSWQSLWKDWLVSRV